MSVSYATTYRCDLGGCAGELLIYGKPPSPVSDGWVSLADLHFCCEEHRHRWQAGQVEAAFSLPLDIRARYICAGCRTEVRQIVAEVAPGAVLPCEDWLASRAWEEMPGGWKRAGGVLHCPECERKGNAGCPECQRLR